MDAFQNLLDRLPNNGTHSVECDYTPSEKERNRRPGGYQSPSLTLNMRADGLREFRDWLYNDNHNTLHPFRFVWTGADATITVDLNLDSVEVVTQNQNILMNSQDYARQGRLRRFTHAHELGGRGRIVRHAPIGNPQNPRNENWERRVVG